MIRNTGKSEIRPSLPSGSRPWNKLLMVNKFEPERYKRRRCIRNLSVTFDEKV